MNFPCLAKIKKIMFNDFVHVQLEYRKKLKRIIISYKQKRLINSIEVYNKPSLYSFFVSFQIKIVAMTSHEDIKRTIHGCGIRERERERERNKKVSNVTSV